MSLNSSGQQDRDLYVSKTKIFAALAAVRRVSIQDIESNWSTCEATPDNEKIDVYSAAVILMNEVSRISKTWFGKNYIAC